MTTNYDTGSPTPPALSPGGRTTIRAVLVIAAALLMLGGLGGLTAAAVGLGSTRVIADAQSLPAGLRELTLDAGQVPMSVRVSTSADAVEPRVEMRFVSSGGDGRHDLSVLSEGSSARIQVVGQSPGWLQWARAGELTVVLPPEVGSRLAVTVIQELGVLNVDADLDRLTARTGNGAVSLRGSARSIEIHHRNGSIHTRQPITVEETFVTEGASGDIRVNFAGAPQRIDTVLNHGDVTLGLPGDGPFVVNASTGSADGRTVVRVPVTLDAKAAQSVVTARSASGNVTVDRRD